MNKIYFFIATLISLPIFAGEAPFDLAGTPELFTPLILAPGNGNAITQAEWEIAEAQRKEAVLQVALQAEKERPKRILAGAIKSVIPRTKYNKEKDGECCSPCCQWVSFYACYGVFVVISAGISIWASFPTFPRDQSWCLQNVSPCTLCDGNAGSFSCYPSSPLCKPYYKQL
jgi:hypothetical protein